MAKINNIIHSFILTSLRIHMSIPNFLEYVPREWGGRHNTPDDPTEKDNPVLLKSGEIPYDIIIRADVSCSIWTAIMVTGYWPILFTLSGIISFIIDTDIPIPNLIIVLIFGSCATLFMTLDAISHVHFTRKKKKAETMITYRIRAVGRTKDVKGDYIDPEYVHMNWEKEDLCSPLTCEEDDTRIVIVLKAEQIYHNGRSRTTGANGAIEYFELDNVLCAQNINPGDLIVKHTYEKRDCDSNFVYAWYLSVEHKYNKS